MKKIHMTRAELDAEAIDLVMEDVTRRAFDGEILPDLISLIPIEKLIEFLPADEEDEEEAARYVLVERQFAALQHWEKVFCRRLFSGRANRFPNGSLRQGKGGA